MTSPLPAAEVKARREGSRARREAPAEAETPLVVERVAVIVTYS